MQQPASILVTFASGEQAPAELVAKDHSRMLVLLKARGVSGLTVPELVPADEIRVGEWAIAVGRTFRADRPNIAVGIVSAVDRMFGKVIQTDASVSTANYGGPLVDIRGRVLGVLVPIAPQSTSEVAGVEWYDSGIGFAVPLASIGPALERMKTGKDQYAGVMGIGLAPENPHGSPAVLATVLASSPAGKAGLKKGDPIVEIDGSPDPHADRPAIRPRHALRRRPSSHRRHARRREDRTQHRIGRRIRAVSACVSGDLAHARRARYQAETGRAETGTS